MKYKLFKKANPDFQSRIEAFTSGILTPDPKGITLWSMDPLRAYTQLELYLSVCSFSGCEPETREFPLMRRSVWQYCNGKGRGGSLEKIGAVVKLKVKRRGNKYVTGYQKTDAGEDFGDAIVARGTYLVNRFSERRNKPNLYSLWKILGGPSKSERVGHRRGYAVYKIIKLLYENEGEKLTCSEIAKEAKIATITCSHVLNDLGNVGVIDYKSPYRDIEGKRAKGWARYKVRNPSEFLRRDAEKLYQEIRKTRPWFDAKSNLMIIIDFIRQDPYREYEYNEIAKATGICPEKVSNCLSSLRELDYLEAEFIGGKVKSIAKANEHTRDLWEILFEPIEKISYNLDPSAYSGFYDILDYYEENEEKRVEAIKKQLEVYDKEKTHIGPRGGEEIRNLILHVLSSSGKSMKFSHIYEEVKKICSRKIESGGLVRHLKILIKSGDVKKVGKGFYKINPSLN